MIEDKERIVGECADSDGGESSIMPDDECTNVYGSKLKDVRRIAELEELVKSLYEEIGRLHMRLREVSTHYAIRL